MTTHAAMECITTGYSHGRTGSPPSGVVKTQCVESHAVAAQQPVGVGSELAWHGPVPKCLTNGPSASSSIPTMGSKRGILVVAGTS